tara:strand:+ start:202 stop:477 length:276 start_codon:yes stop_codon:yes gene_type:complete
MKPQCTATIKLVTEEVRKCIVALECYKNTFESKEPWYTDMENGEDFTGYVKLHSDLTNIHKAMRDKEDNSLTETPTMEFEHNKGETYERSH